MILKNPRCTRCHHLLFDNEIGTCDLCYLDALECMLQDNHKVLTLAREELDRVHARIQARETLPPTPTTSKDDDHARR